MIFRRKRSVSSLGHKLFWYVFGFAISSSFYFFAATGGIGEVVHNIDYNATFLFIGIMLLLAKISGLIERWDQPSVLGELGIGIILGNLIHFQFPFFEAAENNEILKFLGELGLVILLFQAGLESNVKEIMHAGPKAFLVATIGAVAPFVIGAFVVIPIVMPEAELYTRLFIGACLASTSVAIAATLFHSYKQMKSPEAQIVMGSAVIDDVFGMVMLPVMTALVDTGAVSAPEIALIVVKSLGFLIAAVLIGQYTAPYLSKFFAKLNTGTGMKLTFALSLALILAYLAHSVGMSPIIGAFAAGLFLDPIHFDNFENPKFYTEMKHITDEPSFSSHERDVIMKAARRYAHHHIEDLVEPLAHFTVPLFFILVGMNVNLNIFTDLRSLGIALAILIIPIVSRFIAALFTGPELDKGVIGFALVPNDEVGLVFASVAVELGVFDERIFSIVVFVLIMTTLVGSAALNYFLARYTARQHGLNGNGAGKGKKVAVV